MYEIKTNEKCFTGWFYTALLTVGTLAAIIIAYSVPVFASSIPTSDTTITFSVDSSANYNVNTQEDTVIVKVPVFLTLTLSNVNTNKYISGYITATQSFLDNFSCTIDNSGANYLYFEPLDNYGITISRPDNYNTRIYFDNYLFNYNSTGSKFIGYLVYSGICTDGNANVNISNNSWNPTIDSMVLKAYDYEAGFVSAIISALNSTSDIDTIISILNGIDSNTGYLPDILSQLQTYYPSFYNYLSSIASTNSTISSYVQQIFNLLNNIDNTIDTISWETLTTFDYKFYDNTLTEKTSNFSDNIFYCSFGNYLNSDYIYRLTIPIGRNSPFSIKEITFGRFVNGVFYPIEDYIIDYRCYRYSTIVYVNVFENSNASLYYNQGLKFEFMDSATNYVRNTSSVADSARISANDIEYWTIYNAIVNRRTFNILNEQYTAQLAQAEQDKIAVEDSLDQLVIDMNVTKPSAVADIADSYIEQIDTSYNASVFSFLSNNIIILMLCIVFAFAVLSYLLYGGK